MPLSNYEVNIILTWVAARVNTNFTGAGIFAIN